LAFLSYKYTMRHWKKHLPWLGTLLGGVGLGACVTTTQHGFPAPPAAAQEAPAPSVEVATSTMPLGSGVGTSLGGSRPYIPDNEPIVKAVSAASPSVVSVDTTTTTGGQMFRDRFGRTFSLRGEEVPAGTGSGILLEGNYVLTNQHVIEPAKNGNGHVMIRLEKGEKYEAEIVGADRTSDVALLKVKGNVRLPSASLGDKDELKPGQTVIAIGNPVGLSASVSAGVVSALGRPIEQEGRIYESLIQTDTAINPGNSGGALVDLGGRVVGINTLVQRGQGGIIQGIGFAIPIQKALAVAEDLKRFGRVRRPWTGVIGVTMNNRIAEQLDLPDDTQGVAVAKMYRNSPADRAGLQPGDVIVALNKTPVTNDESYRRVLNSLKIGQVAEITILREAKKYNAKITIGESPE
jgi:serine protease Do